MNDNAKNGHLYLPHEELPLFSGEPPLKRPEDAGRVERFTDDGDFCYRLTDIATPAYTFYPATGMAPHPLVVVCPGGGYSILAYNHEGLDVAHWLLTLGVSVLLLKYRCPDRRDQALADARRAVRVARANAAAWNVDPNKIGIMGFSAGAHLSVRTCCAKDADYPHTDAIDEVSPHPDFAIIVYPAYIVREGWTSDPDLDITAEKVPPTFLIQSQDDPYWESSVAYAIALRKAGVKFELHLLPDGGHGWGMNRDGRSYDGWGDLAARWMAGNGLIV